MRVNYQKTGVERADKPLGDLLQNLTPSLRVHGGAAFKRVPRVEGQLSQRHDLVSGMKLVFTCFNPHLRR